MSQEQTRRVYCVDTSSLVSLKHWRPAKRFPEPWKRLDELIEDGRLVAPDAVLHEVHAVDDALLKWARAHKKMFKRTSRDVVQTVQEIVARFIGLVDPNQLTKSADPFVVAMAVKVKGSRDLFTSDVIVITEEKYAEGRPRIPHECEGYGLKYLTIHQMFLFEGWSF